MLTNMSDIRGLLQSVTAEAALLYSVSPQAFLLVSEEVADEEFCFGGT